MVADIAFAFKWSLQELKALPLEELKLWHEHALRYYPDEEEAADLKRRFRR